MKTFLCPDTTEDRSEDRINKILSEVNKSADKFPLTEPHPALLLPNNTDELKLAALSFYQNELSQLQKLPVGMHGEQSEEDNGQVGQMTGGLQRNISYQIIFRMSPRTATKIP